MFATFKTSFNQHTNSLVTPTDVRMLLWCVTVVPAVPKRLVSPGTLTVSVHIVVQHQLPMLGGIPQLSWCL